MTRRSLDPFRLSWLDFKFGFRMLARYPGLTLVGTVAIAVCDRVGSDLLRSGQQAAEPAVTESGGRSCGFESQLGCERGRARWLNWRTRVRDGRAG